MQLEAVRHLCHTSGDDLHLGLNVRRRGQHHNVETALQCGGHLVDPLISGVRRGDDGEALFRCDLLREFRNGDALFRQDGDQSVLHLAGAAGDLLDTGDGARFHCLIDGAFYEGVEGGAFCQQHGIIPRIANLFLRRSGSALNNTGGVAVDGGGEVLRQPRLRRARLTDQQQRTVGDQRCNANFHNAPVAHVLGCDDLIPHFSAHDIGEHRAWRHAPALRHGIGFCCDQGIQLLLKLLLCGAP